MDSRYRHDPFSGLARLRENEANPCVGFDAACAQAERELGCVPAGRLRQYVLLSAAAAMLQRVRASNGIPLFMVKGGLIWQMLLGSQSRPTYDLDGALACSVEEFIDQAQDSLSEPWGRLNAQIEHAHVARGRTVPHAIFHFDLAISTEGKRIATIPCEGTYGEPAFMREGRAYPAAAIDAVGLPAPDMLWGIKLARGICSKVLNTAEPYAPTGDPAYAGYVRPHRKAKHLADAVLLSRLCEEGTYCTYDELRVELQKRVAFENEARMLYGYPTFDHPLHVLPHKGWEVEYLVAAIQSGLALSYDDALAEIDGLFKKLGV